VQTPAVPTAAATATLIPVPTNTPNPTPTTVEIYPSSGSVEFSILHWNDFHHHLFEANPGVNWIPGAARLGGFVAAEREKRGVNQTLVLDAGDWMTMDGEYNRYMGEDQIEVYKLIGVDATVIGNHELDFRAPRLMELMEQSEPMKILSINMQKTNDEGKCTTRHLADGYNIFVLGPDSGPKVRVAVVGVTATGAEWDSRNSPAKWPICFSDPTQKIIDLYSTLKETEKADIIVLLTHLGYDVDQQLAQTLIDAGTPADIVIGGHAYYPCVYEPFQVGDTYVVSACEMGQYVGMFDISYDRSISKMNAIWTMHKLTPLDPVDPAITAYLKTMFPEKIASTSTPMPEGNYLIDLAPVTVTVGYWSLGAGLFPASDGGFSEGQVLFSHGVTYPMGLFAHAPSRLVYDLNGKYTRLETDIMVQDSACGDGAEFVVQLDGKELYASSMLSAFHDPVHLSLDITGGKELILITLSGEDNSCDWTIWGDPYLVK